MSDPIHDRNQTEMLSGCLLIFSLITAMIMANSAAFSQLYQKLVFYPIYLKIGRSEYGGSFLQLVNDGLMTFFFLLIGLELKFHLIKGCFQNPKKLILPSVAALGGVIGPAIIYFLINIGTPEYLDGWAIPIATDTAFMLAILSFFHHLVSEELRAFIIGFSLIDDALALLILAVFYTKSASELALILTCLLTGLLVLMNRKNILNTYFYLLVGVLLWIAMVFSGIHGTLAGVIVAMAIPIVDDHKMSTSFIDLEVFLKPIVYFVLLPLFAFMNSGISFANISLDVLNNPLSLGVILGLTIGKPLGMLLPSALIISLKFARLPEKTSWQLLIATCLLGGVGFTLSLFIGDLAFERLEPNYFMRIGVIIGSIISAILGILTLLRITITQ